MFSDKKPAHATFERQKQISEQVEADLQTQRIQQRTVKKQLEDDKRLFYALATRQLEGIDIDKYDPVHDISMPAIRPVNGMSVYNDPWRVQTNPFDGNTTSAPTTIIGNSLFNTSNTDMETWSWKGRPIVKMKSTGISTIPNTNADDENNNTTTIDAKIESKSDNDINNNDVVVDNVEKSIVTSIFDIIDKEHKGSISKRAFLKAVQLNQKVQDLMASNANLKCLLQHKLVDAKFKIMDENHDNAISVEEMLMFANEINNNNASEE